MPTELELKLSLPANLHDDFRALDMLAGGIEDTQELYNAYFDTPDQQLNQARIALRIRKQGERFIQTLKTRGADGGGMHDRQEWEWDLPEPTLNTNVVRQEIPDMDVQWDQLSTLFETNFTRGLWMIETVNSSIEVVLDSGAVKHDDKSDNISEVELELKEGEAEELYTIAEILTDSLPLRIGLISKAQRGYRLLHGAPIPEQIEPEDCLQALTALQNLMEWLDYTADAAAIPLLATALEQLQQLLPGPFHLDIRPQWVSMAEKLKDSTDIAEAQALLWDREFCQALLRVSAYLYLNK